MNGIPFIVIRHGETDYNKEGRYQGSVDIPLNETGRDQARCAIDLIRPREIEVILSSHLLRARETAEIIGQALGLEVRIHPEFAERNMGVFEGLTRDEIMVKYPEFWQRDINRQMHSSVPGSESLLELSLRVHLGLKRVQQLYGDRKVLLVCHGGVTRSIHGLLRRVTDDVYFRYQLHNGEMDEYLL